LTAEFPAAKAVNVLTGAPSCLVSGQTGTELGQILSPARKEAKALANYKNPGRPNRLLINKADHCVRDFPRDILILISYIQ
jgi:hypothetical protein